MKPLLLGSLIVALALPAILPAQSADADRAFADFESSKRPTPPSGLDTSDRAAQLRWSDSAQQEIGKRGLDLIAAYPNDPRRWEIVQFISSGIRPYFVKEIGPDFATVGMKAVVIDETAKAKWTAKLAELRQAMAAATDVPPGPREEMDWSAFAKDFRAMTQAKTNGLTYDYSVFLPRFEAHAAKFTDLADTIVRRADDYLGALARYDESAAANAWVRLAEKSPSDALRAHAKKKVQFADVMSRPLDIAFTAADGRKVDLKDLRGKVVLIDFWATWCGPCIAELPNVKKVYSEYHDKGFDVVGIALENAKLTPKDTPEQKERKLTAARKVLTDFTTKENMLWPQYFDGKWWNNDISTKYFIQGIPAMFLLDQQGKVATTNARGEKLEAEVRRLLGL
ncbi:MAG: TlpA family protein disulfide reductase [Opitutaceae bacterium]|nr:TlpA family protein disulfide reductase [Opitutaceae bacterium]